MSSSLLLILTGFFVKTFARVSAPSCFVQSNGPYGSNNGDYFTDIVDLNADWMTVDMRISSVNVCKDR